MIVRRPDPHQLVPRLCLFITIATVVALPLMVVSRGFTPTDDVLRDVAKAVSGRDWGDVILLRPGLSPDLNTHVGWEMILSTLHAMGVNKFGLLMLAIAGLASLAFLPPALYMRRPEIGIFLLLSSTILDFDAIHRCFFGRPYLIGMFCLSSILFLWDRFAAQPRNAKLIVAFVCIIAIRVWTRSTLIMLGIPLAAILASAILHWRWRPLLYFMGCLTAGAILGTLMTGQPVEFLVYNFRHFYVTLFSDQASAYRVSELGPLKHSPMIFLFFVTYLCIRTSAGRDSERLKHPAFLLVLLGWLLSFFIARFWLEYGFPAMLVWIALDLQDALEKRMPRDSLARLAFSIFCAVALCIAALKPHEALWKRNPLAAAVNVERLYQTNPSWFPGEGGVLYSGTMRIFFTFHHLFPHARWKYSTGMEAGFMPEKDLRVYEAINLTRAAEAYLPWVEGLRPHDRVVIPQPRSKNIDQVFPMLDWNFIEPEFWFGRPKSVSAAAETATPPATIVP